MRKIVRPNSSSEKCQLNNIVILSSPIKLAKMKNYDNTL